MKTTTGIIDRFEGDFAVVEINGDTYDLPRNILPEEATVGQHLILNIEIDIKGTAAREKEIKGLMDDLFE
ncbi:DUF3006 domain-containing protein [Brevibacillus daliensis]|uniref:DUF3006 domain-containing protein n=1 Tax=Brevibacillus daliensis TaxID=2892995 RepID=UPI001E2E0EFE|nr:DUF3006 domain-containing protein [Brevibacillus daliensis]